MRLFGSTSPSISESEQRAPWKRPKPLIAVGVAVILTAGLLQIPGMPMANAYTPPKCNKQHDTNAKQAACWAESQIGVPYVYGAVNPKGGGNGSGFDCSGLVMWSYYKAFRGSYTMARTTGTQVNEPRFHRISPNTKVKDMRAGDLVFTPDNQGDSLGHVSMYVGGGQMVNAPYTGQLVRKRAFKDVNPTAIVRLDAKYNKVEKDN